MELPIRGKTKGVCNKGFNLRSRLLLGVPHHQDVVSPLAGCGHRRSCRWRPVNQLGIGCLHTVDLLLNLPLTKMYQLQGRRYYEASDQTITIKQATRLLPLSKRPDFYYGKRPEYIAINWQPVVLPTLHIFLHIVSKRPCSYNASNIKGIWSDQSLKTKFFFD